MRRPTRCTTVLGMIEPAMTIVIGLAVGFLALSIFVPIYSSIEPGRGKITAMLRITQRLKKAYR